MSLNFSWYTIMVVQANDRDNRKMIPLFKKFPELKKNLPWLDLFKKPTPVLKLKHLGAYLGLDHLYLKQDGLTGSPFGGNKVRKLEFLLADAVSKGFQEVMTTGYAGSNHALATSVYAHKLGLKSISMLVKQQNARYVRKNLLMSLFHQTELHHYSSRKLLPAAIRWQNLRHKWKTGQTPYPIPLGGSTPLGITGFINAAFELYEQIKEKQLPKPQLIYLGLGTSGTYLGLLIGIKILDLDIKLVPVRIIDRKLINPALTEDLFKKTVNYLRSQDNSFPRLSISREELQFREGFLGSGYAHFTPEGIQAVRLMKKKENISLDGTYTGKAFSAVIHDARSGSLRDKTILFWNTLNAREPAPQIKNLPYQRLPKKFHPYFTGEIPPGNQIYKKGEPE